MSDDGRRKLREYGIAPPQAGSGRRALFRRTDGGLPAMRLRIPSCSPKFGSTSCKALWRCKSCREPFDYFQCH